MVNEYSVLLSNKSKLTPSETEIPTCMSTTKVELTASNLEDDLFGVSFAPVCLWLTFTCLKGQLCTQNILSF